MTGSVQIKNGKYWISLNQNNDSGQREGQIWINTLLPQRGNKKRATEILNELVALEPSAFTSRFVMELKVFIKQQAAKIADRYTEISKLFLSFIAKYEQKENCGMNVNQSQDMPLHELMKVFIAIKKEYVAQHTHRMYLQAHKNWIIQ